MPKIAFMPWSISQVFKRFHHDSHRGLDERAHGLVILAVLSPALVYWSWHGSPSLIQDTITDDVGDVQFSGGLLQKF